MKRPPIDRYQTAISWPGAPAVSSSPGVSGHHGLRAVRLGHVHAEGFNLLPHLSARDNVALSPWRVNAVSRAEARERAMAPLERVGRASRALDPEMVGEVLAVMRGLAEDGMTMVCVATKDIVLDHSVLT